MASYLFTGGRFLDPRRDELVDGVEILVEDNLIKEVSDRPITSATAQRIDIGKRTLMPGLIDAHIHIVLSEVKETAQDAHKAKSESARTQLSAL